MKNSSIPLSGLEKFLITLSVLIIGGVAGTIIALWGDIPKRIPIHYGFTGKADNYGDKSMLIVLLVVITTVFASVLFSSKFQKSYLLKENDENSIKLYKNDRLMRIFIGLETVLIMAVIEIKTILITQGRVENLGEYTVPFIIVLIFMTMLIFYLRSRKIRRNT